MKKISLLICVALLTTAAATFAQSESSPAPSTSASATAKKYTCTMHPEVVQDKPGKCPKCGMKLVPKKEDNNGAK